MKDRVAAKPNRYAVYDDNHNFLRYEYHERADEPTQEGTPLNKGTLLSDETADYIELDSAEEVTVSAGLKRLSPRVGDTITTARNDLSDKWLLCNGESVAKVDYPSLASAAPQAFLGTIPGQVMSSTRENCAISSSTPPGFLRVEATKSSPIVYYAPFSDSKDLIWQTGPAIPREICRCVRFLNNQWVVLMTNNLSDSTQYSYVYSNSSAIPLTSWTSNTISYSGGIHLLDIAYTNGMYYACGSIVPSSTSNQRAILMSAPSLSSTWTTLFTGDNYSVLNKIAVHDTTVVAVGKTTSGSTTGLIVSSPTGTSFTARTVSASGSLYYAQIMGTKLYYASSDKFYVQTGSYDTPTLLSISTRSTTGFLPINDTQMYVMSPTTVDIYDTYSDAVVLSCPISSSLSQNSCAGNSGRAWFLPQGTTDLLSTDYTSLPTISNNLLYTYIRAKE